jgi:hypothetical protein
MTEELNTTLLLTVTVLAIFKLPLIGEFENVIFAPENITFAEFNIVVFPLIVTLPVGVIATADTAPDVIVTTLLVPLVTATFASIVSTPLADTFPPESVLETYTNVAPK